MSRQPEWFQIRGNWLFVESVRHNLASVHQYEEESGTVALYSETRSIDINAPGHTPREAHANAKQLLAALDDYFAALP